MSNPFSDNPFLEAADAGDLPAIKLRLAENPERITEMDEYGSTVLLLAAYSGNVETVMWLLREGDADIGDVDVYGHSALILSA
jgi:ankyrin repeat protein